MSARKRAAAVIAMLLAAVGAAPARAAGPHGARFGAVVASLPERPDLGSYIDTVRHDGADHVLVVAHQRIATFDPDGRLRAEWTVPGAAQPYDRVTADITAGGTVYAAMSRTDIVHVYGLDGVERARFGGSGVLNAIDQVVVDPRGSVLVIDGYEESGYSRLRMLRFTLSGAPLGPVPGGPIAPALTVAADGSRWAAGYNGLAGVDAAGQLFGLIGRYCDMRLDAIECAHDTGHVVDTTDLAVDDRHRVIAVEPASATFQLYGASGHLRLTCGSPDFRHFTVSAADPVPGGLLIGYGLTVRRLQWTTKPGGPCRSPRMRLTGVHARRSGTDGRTWRLSYRLNARGRVWVDVFREHTDPCATEAVNSFDPHGLCTNLSTTYRGRRLPAARGRNTARLRLPSGRWQIQLRAINGSSEGVEAPLIKLTTVNAG